MLLSEFLTQHYLPEHVLSLQPQSLDQLRYSAEHFTKWLGHPAATADFTKLLLVGFLANRIKDGRSPGTVNKDRRSLLCLWHAAADLGLCPQPPRIPKVREPASVPHTFTADELKELLAAAARMPDVGLYHGPTWWASLLVFLYQSGARITAALKVETTDVDFVNRVVVLRGENAKTHKTQVVSINDTGVFWLRKQISTRRGEVWPWPKHHRRLFEWFKRLVELTSVEMPARTAFHSFRRTHATAVCELFGLEAASRQLAHSSIAVTRRYVANSRLTVPRIADSLPGF